MRNALFINRGLVVDSFWKKYVFGWIFTTVGVCSNFRRVDNQPGFTLFLSHIFQVIIHYQKRFFTPVIFLFLPTINTPYKNINYLNKTISLPGGCV